MRVKPLRPDLLRYAQKHSLTAKLTKQIRLFTDNFRHPSLHTEILEPKSLSLYSFRIDHKYRAIFIITPDHQVEIIDINDHYQT